MNSATLLAVNLYAARPAAGEPPRLLDVYWEPEAEDLGRDLCRMLAVWPHLYTVRPAGPSAAPPTAAEDAVAAWVTQELGGGAGAEGVFVATVPADPIELGFAQEVEAHDHELGGYNDWTRDETVSFSPRVLQALSSAHSRRLFPRKNAFDDIEALRAGGVLKVLDIGCGPISVLRWGELTGRLQVTGVDPLNDLYDAVLARHGWDRLEKIRPSRRIVAFAETMDVQGEDFDLVFSANALDHTQDVDRSFASIADAVRPGGAAIITVNTREGTRQGFHGLHKYDLWFDGDLMVAERDTPGRRLLADLPLRVERVYVSDAEATSVMLRRDRSAAGGALRRLLERQSAQPEAPSAPGAAPEPPASAAQVEAAPARVSPAAATSAPAPLEAPIKFVVAMAISRSGSTLLQGVLNSIDGFLVRGENYGATLNQCRIRDALVHAKLMTKNLPTDPRNPFFGGEQYDPDAYVEDARATLIRQLMGAERGPVRGLGFKEVRWMQRDLGDLVMWHYMEFLEALMPGVRFILLTRRPEEICRSAWWANRDPRQTTLDIEGMYLMARNAPVRHLFEIDYAELVHDRSALRRMFEFLDEPYEEERVEPVLATKHSVW